jgi:transposase
MSVIAAAATFRVSRAYIYKALMRRRLTGDPGPSLNRGHAPRKLTPAQETALAAHMTAHPGITLARVQDWLAAEYGVSLSTGGTWNAVHRLGLSHKKSR